MIMRIIYLLLILGLSAQARYDAYPLYSCEAFNDLRHRSNTHHVVLDPKRTYTVLKHHKGQYLVKIPDESPATRWVDDRCLQRAHKDQTAKNRSKRQDLLVLSWQNTFCEKHRNTQECKLLTREKRSLLALHGLWPQPKTKNYCNIPSKLIAKDKHHQWRALPRLELGSKTREALSEIMPGYSSALHRHEWIKHGSCYGADAERYYSDAIRWTRKIVSGSVGKLLQNRIGRRVTLSELRKALEKDFGQGVGDRLDLHCDRGMISELWLHLGGDSNDLSKRLQAGSHAHSRCRGGIVDTPGYR